MFIVLLKFLDNKGNAGQFMEGHKEWIKSGFDDGVFLLAGSLQPNLGGGIVAHNTSLPDLQSRVNTDPFVAEKVVKAEILEITPSRTDARTPVKPPFRRLRNRRKGRTISSFQEPTAPAASPHQEPMRG